MNRDDIIRKFLDLHPDTPLNWDVQYAIHLRAIKRMLEVAAAAEREECLAACRMYQDDDEPYPGFQNGVSCCIAAIENHEEFLEHMRKKGAP